MSPRRSLHSSRALLVFTVLAALATVALPAGAAPWAGNRNRFASPRFEEVWRAADQAVQQGSANRSWTWGPGAWFDYKEVYKQSPNGLRLVQYFDKARMEINDPANTSGPLRGVTNGLLVVELVSGRIKLGNGTGPDQNLQWTTAEIPVAGDLNASNEAPNPVTPSYISFRTIATVDNGYRDQSKVGQRVGTTLARKEPWGVVGNIEIGSRQDLANQPGTDIVAYEAVTGHNIPRVFNDFMNAGPVPAIAAFGYPISDAYWITARVGGQDKDVLVQLFERRALTYTPSNPAAFRVEMGNVGQHYFSWRYHTLGTPWATPDPRRDIVFATKRDAPDWDIYAMDAAGNILRQGPMPRGAVPYSLFPSWAAYFVVYGEIPCVNGNRQIIMGLPLKPNFLSSCDANAYDPAISPDGNMLAFVSDRDGNPELHLSGSAYGLNPFGYKTLQLTESAGCSIGRPSWLPDGSGLIFESNCRDGNYEIYRASLDFTLNEAGEAVMAKVIRPEEAQRLTTNAANDRWPRVSPDGSHIAFFVDHDGNTEVYTMMVDGGKRTRLTTNPARDEGPVWSPDGSKIAFNSNRDGDHEIYVMNADGGGLTQLTNNAVDDGFAVWAQ